MRDIQKKWNTDRSQLPLDWRHFDLYKLIHQRSLERLNQLPNLIEPKTFNDYVNWCKLFDQCPEAIIACDKATAGAYASNRGLSRIVRPIQQTTKNLMAIDPSEIQYPCVMKCNHDSGSYRFVDTQPKNFQELQAHFKPRLARPYGVRGGEWHYSLMPRCIVIEDNMNPTGDPLEDFKFHCVDGNFLFCQNISERKHGAKEINIDCFGDDLGILFDENFSRKTRFDIPDQYQEMIEIAETIAAPFKYARVDLYLINGMIYLGEVTLHPRGGYYPGQGQVEIGKMMQMDLTTYREPIWRPESAHGPH